VPLPFVHSSANTPDVALLCGTRILLAVISMNLTSIPLVIRLYNSEATPVHSRHTLARFHALSSPGQSTAPTPQAIFDPPASLKCPVGWAGPLCPKTICLLRTPSCPLCRSGQVVPDHRLLPSRHRLDPVMLHVQLPPTPTTLYLRALSVRRTASRSPSSLLPRVPFAQPQSLVAVIDRGGKDGSQSPRTSCCQTTSL
jgi:hypothetical protein